MNNERCELCRNYKRLKHNFTRGKGFEESYCCDLFGDEKGGWIQEVTPDGMCEVFSRKVQWMNEDKADN